MLLHAAAPALARTLQGLCIIAAAAVADKISAAASENDELVDDAATVTSEAVAESEADPRRHRR